MSIIKELYIKNFRLFTDVTIPLGKKITIIAGQNATGKSTLLGMLGQPFTYPTEEKTIFNGPFTTKFSDILKLDPLKEPPESHEYHVRFYNNLICDELDILVKSRKRSEPPYIRLVTRDEDRTQGKGNIELPVIYLGMRRVYPIGEIKDIKEAAETGFLNANEELYFKENHNRILVLNEDLSSSHYYAKNKNTLCAETTKYSARANSAGQDNLGQILGSIVSFQRLKNKFGPAYKGGLLLVDEIDTALYPGAQVRLMDYFIACARGLNLQIAFTTHSLVLIEHLSQEKYQHNNDIEIVYLAKSKGKLDRIPDADFPRIKSDLAMVINETQSIPKVNIYCEDHEAAIIIKNLLPQSWKKRVSIIYAKLSGGILLELARSNVDEFKNSIITLDGDMFDKLPNHQKFPNVLLLPGEKSPENMFKNYLNNLPEDDDFWAEAGRGYTKQHFIDRRPNTDAREPMKDWFKNEIVLWGGRSMSKLYRRWLQDNSAVLTSFRNSFSEKFNRIAKEKGLPPLE